MLTNCSLFVAMIEIATKSCYNKIMRMGDNMNLSKKLKILRKNAGLSQTDVAKKLNITRQAYNNYETGIREPSLESLRAISDVFGVDISDLISNDVITKQVRNPKNETHYYPDTIDTSELTEDDKKDLENYINYLKFRRRAIEMNVEFSAELQPRFN